MSRHAEGSIFRFAVEAGRLAVADNLHRSMSSVDCPVRNGVDLAIELRAPDLELNLIAEQCQQRNHPKLSCLGCSGGFRLEAFEFALKDAPEVLRVSPGPDDFVLY